MIIIQEGWREDKYVSKPLQNDRPGKSVADPGSGFKQKHDLLSIYSGSLYLLIVIFDFMV